VGAHAIEVAASHLGVDDDVIADGLGNSRSDVIGVRRSCDTAATRLRRAASD
jgi:hypothetical protein